MKIIHNMIIWIVITVTLFIAETPVYAKIKVVTTIPDFGAIAKEIGNDKVEIKSIVKGYQDPHFVDAKPSYILWLNKADLLIYNGLNLEIGWLPVLVTGSRNSKITAADSVGNLNVSTLIPNILEIPKVKVDRSMGDVHPGGNPHYTLDPRNGLQIANGIAERLMSIDPENSSIYEENLNIFNSNLKYKINEWESMIKPFRGTNVVTYHKSWVYFTDWAGFNETGYIEPKPGIPPNPSHLANLIKKIQDMKVRLVFAELFYPQKTALLIAQKTDTKLLILPTMVDSTNGINSYTELFDKMLSNIVSSLNNQG